MWCGVNLNPILFFNIVQYCSSQGEEWSLGHMWSATGPTTAQSTSGYWPRRCFQTYRASLGRQGGTRRLGCRQGSNLSSPFFWKQIDTHVFNAGWGALTHQQCHHGFLGPGVWGQASVWQVFKILVQFCLLFIPTSGQFKDRIGPLTLRICHLAIFSSTVISRWFNSVRFAWFKLYSQDRLYSPLPPNLQLLEAKAEGIFDKLNNHHQGMVASAVYCMKKKALKCLRAMGGTFEGRRV